MYWKVTGVWRGKLWKDEYCPCCGKLENEYIYESNHKINDTVEAACREWAIEKALDNSGVDEFLDDGKWIEPLTATLIPTDQVLAMLGAPRLFREWEMV